jgi:hypothetical protein
MAGAEPPPETTRLVLLQTASMFATERVRTLSDLKGNTVGIRGLLLGAQQVIDE